MLPVKTLDRQARNAIFFDKGELDALLQMLELHFRTISAQFHFPHGRR
jgi:hypothetical protein